MILSEALGIATRLEETLSVTELKSNPEPIDGMSRSFDACHFFMVQEIQRTLVIEELL